jgi:GNAT superfamily N-acetyltransferase
VHIRQAQVSDTDAITETITVSFHNDPVWSWAFPDPELRPEQFRPWWRLFVIAGLRNDWLWVTDHCESVAVWAPPAAEELGPAEVDQIGPLLGGMLGDHAPAVFEMLGRFEAAHPHDEPHYYLSIVGTHDDHRGQGIGVQLLAHNLDLIDAEHLPAYLESSNPGNHDRYRRLGFEECGGFEIYDGGPPVMSMWRSAR